MAYTKKTWVDNTTPLSATNLNNLETQYDQVKTELAKAGTSDVKVHAKNITNSGEGSGLDADKFKGAVRLGSWKPGPYPLNDQVISTVHNSPAPIPAKKAEMACPNRGGLRIKMSVRTDTAGRPASAQIYRNGSPVGILRGPVTTTTPVEYVEDISGWELGDLLQVYISGDGGTGYQAAATVKLFVNSSERYVITIY